MVNMSHENSMGSIIQLVNSKKLVFGKNEDTGERYNIVQCSKCNTKYKQYTIIGHELEEIKD